MSNLKLPVMSKEALSKLVGTRFMKRVAHNTHVSGYPDSLYIYYHNNLISVVGDERLVLSNAGWNTTTTSARLNKILKDNCPNTRYRVGIRNGWTSLIDNNTALATPFSHLVIDRATGEPVVEL